jgi:hypothetical protein
LKLRIFEQLGKSYTDADEKAAEKGDKWAEQFDGVSDIMHLLVTVQ